MNSRFFSLLLLPLNGVEVGAALLQVAHTTMGVEVGEVGKVDIGDESGLGIVGCFGDDSFVAEGKVTG